MDYTPIRQLPYLTPTDKAKNIPAQSKAIAERFESLIESGELRGEPGAAGLPGVNAVPADTAVAEYLRNELSLTHAAANELWPTLLKVDQMDANRQASTLADAALRIERRTRVTATITAKYQASPAAEYEVVHVHCGGQPIPGIVDKAYAYDFHLDPAKRGDNFKDTSGGESLASHYKRSGADILSNASGWDTDTAASTYLMLRGAQIKDGIIYRDLEPERRGVHALGVHWDGSWHPYRYEAGDRAAAMVAAGVRTTFGFGPLLTMNGQKRDIVAESGDPGLKWYSVVTGRSGRQILGVTADHDIKLITVWGRSSASTGLSGNEIVDLAYKEGLYHSIMLDGGGSAQTMVAGHWTHPSTDTGGIRTTGDALMIYARPTEEYITPWESLILASGVKETSAGRTPQVRRNGPNVEFRGAISPTSGTFATGTWHTPFTLPRERYWADLENGTTFYVPNTSSGASGVANFSINQTAHPSIQMQTSVAATYIDLAGLKYPAFY